MAVAEESSHVVVIGAGMVGQVLTACLAQDGLSVTIIDQAPPVIIPTVRPDVRVVALSHASVALLESIGVWGDIRALGAYPYENMVVWESIQRQPLAFNAHLLGYPHLGFIVENLVIQSVLAEKLASMPNVRSVSQTKLASLQIQSEHVQVSLDGGDVLQAPLVVGADGARSMVRKVMAAGEDIHDPEQHAIVAHLTSELGFAKTAWQKFLPTGTVAFLPTGAKDCILVWSLPVDEYRAYLQMSATQFTDLLGSVCDNKFGKLTLASMRRSFPLRSMHAHHYVSDRLALVGDAAHTVHPLAGQGANLGMLDAAALANQVSKQYQLGRDIGLSHNLRAYERQRRADNEMMRRSFDLINQAFRSSSSGTQVFRGLGMSILNQLPAVKSQFIDHALGARFDSPIQQRLKRVL